MNLLNIIPKNIKIIDPEITGDIKNSNDAELEIIIIGFPPAGGWVMLNNIMKATPKPTDKGIVREIGKGTKLKNNIPINDVRKCPKKMFFGFANGLSGYP